MRRNVALMVISILIVGGCNGGSGGEGGGGGGGGGTPISRSTTPAGSSVESADELVDRILEDVDAADGTAGTARLSDLALPGSMKTYLKLRNIEVRTIERTDPLVNSVCSIAETEKSGDVLEAVINGVLTKLRIAKSVKGLGLLVSAVGVGCKALAPKFSYEIRLADPAPQPTLPPATSTLKAKLLDSVSVTEGDRRVLEVRIDSLKCTEMNGAWRAPSGRGYIGVNVSITATSDGEEYDENYWTLEVDSSAVAEPILNFRTDWPALGFGLLNIGQTATGWILFNVPDQSSGFTVTYQGNPYTSRPVFYVSSGRCEPA